LKEVRFVSSVNAVFIRSCFKLILLLTMKSTSNNMYWDCSGKIVNTLTQRL